MKIKDIIEQLQTQYNQDDEVIINWWGKNHINPLLTNDQWQSIILSEDTINWSSIIQQIIGITNEYEIDE